MTRTDDGSRSTDPYLFFAHEPYYPGPNTREINTSLLDVLLRRPRTHRGGGRAPGPARGRCTGGGRSRGAPIGVVHW